MFPLILSQRMSLGWSGMVTSPQLEMACEDLKCQIECASSKANEQQLGQGMGKVTWPAVPTNQGAGTGLSAIAQSRNLKSSEVVCEDLV